MRVNPGPGSDTDYALIRAHRAALGLDVRVRLGAYRHFDGLQMGLRNLWEGQGLRHGVVQMPRRRVA